MEKRQLTDDVLSPGDAMSRLADLQHRFQVAARSLPQFAADESTWDGLVFSVSGIRVTAALNEVSEMLAVPERITRVPGARSWMLGLANIRSSLLPIIDLQLYLGARAVVIGKQARVLVIRQHGLVSGLLVPSVQGMRHFHVSDRVSEVRVKGALGAYVYEAFNEDEAIWPVISMPALASDPAFRSAVKT
jgi:twitching motility protein PilI